MTLFPQLRALVFLRRITRALERIALAQEDQLFFTRQEWEVKHAPRKPAPVELGTLDVVEVNKRYHEERKTRMEEPD